MSDHLREPKNNGTVHLGYPEVVTVTYGNGHE